MAHTKQLHADDVSLPIDIHVPAVAKVACV